MERVLLIAKEVKHIMPVYDETDWREREEYHMRCEMEYEMQQAEYYFSLYQQEQEHLEEMEKYPLFFWRELCSKQRKETCKNGNT